MIKIKNKDNSMKKFTVLDFKRKKNAKEKITMLTAYDYLMAKIIDEAGIDSILVGDSLSMVALGYDDTLSITMDEMIHHCKAVNRGRKNAFLIADMPFMSYQASDYDAIFNAGRFVKEAGCEAVKVEGGEKMSSRINAIINIDIPVIGHLGLTPQSIHKLGGYKVQGKDIEDVKKIIKDAIILEQLGCFAIVLECVPKELVKKIKDKVQIPIIGIGAGNYCDGQVLVTHDILGFCNKVNPKFVKKYANVEIEISKAIKLFKEEVDSNIFPNDQHSFI